MANLSPAAQEILDATRFEVNAECHAPWIAAAVLRAVADQVIPEGMGISYTKQDIRDSLLAIANELDGV